MTELQHETLLERLRTETAESHRGLEDRLDLLALPADEAHFIGVLKGFLAFHLAYEPAAARHPDFAAFTADRHRLPQLREDLAALGVPAAEIEAVAPEARAAHLFDDAARGWGSLYVVEGSTLGGAVITKALAGTPWLPADGLTYFSPYGRETGRMWNGFRACFLAGTQSLDPEAVIAGARETFDLMAAILPRRARA